MLEQMRIALQLDTTGHVYQYFLREPDLDPYREQPEYKQMVKECTPRTVRQNSEPTMKK